jgi:glycosyltransferase involved in cell wall biosynthesis
MSRASERGLLRHLAYLVQASVLLQILRSNRIPHVHVHFGTNAAAVARLIRTLGGPTYSMTVHGAEFDSPLGFSLAEKSADASFVAAISSFSYAQLCRWVAPSQWHKLHVVRCSVNDEFFEMPGQPHRSSRSFLSIGRFSAEKGHLLLLDAMTRVVAHEPEARLVLVGDGEFRPLIEQRIRDLGLGDHVKLTGWLDELAVRMQIRDARVLVHPSFSEGLPVVIMEAFALGLPVISTSVGGIPELVRAGENGWLVTVGNVEELAAALLESLKAPAAKLEAMGQAGRDRVIARHRAATEVSVLERLLVAAIPE